MNKPYINELVSVIIPVYNAEKYISKAIESVLEQSYKNIEIVLVDDCSSDGSGKIINSYLNKYKNINYFVFKRNCGVAAARNKAIELSKGRFIAFLDSDDEWYPNKIEKQLELMKYKNSAICYTAIEMIDENDRLIKGKRNVLEQVNYKILLKNTMLATSSIVIDRLLIGDLRMENRRIGEDYATWLKLLRNGTIASGINDALVKYRKGQGSLSSKKMKNLQIVRNIQIREEGITPIVATLNCFFYAFNAFKKHYL